MLTELWATKPVLEDNTTFDGVALSSPFVVVPPTMLKFTFTNVDCVVPETSVMAERLDAVLHVIYLVFNEGYSASSGGSVTRADLSAEAIRLGRLLVE